MSTHFKGTVYRELFKFVWEPIFMLNSLPLSSDFSLLFLNYQMNNILVILKKSQ